MSRSGIMLCYPFEEKRLLKWQPPYIIQPKLDGERCRYVRFGESSMLLSSEENPTYGVPHIKMFLDSFPNLEYELDGELYAHGLRHEQIHSIVSRERTIHEDYQSIQFHIFDVVVDLPQHQRITLLNKIEAELYKNAKARFCVRFVPYYIAYNLDDVMQCYNHILEDGYEGIIVREFSSPYIRRRSPMIMKFKPKKSDTYKVVGYVEEVSIKGEPKGSLGALVCVGDDGTYFKVGTGFTRDDRIRLWEIRDTLLDKLIEISYQHLTHASNVPRFPVFSRIISED